MCPLNPFKENAQGDAHQMFNVNEDSAITSMGQKLIKLNDGST